MELSSSTSEAAARDKRWQQSGTTGSAGVAPPVSSRNVTIGSIVLGFVVIWVYMHRALVGSGGAGDAYAPRGRGIGALPSEVTTENILRLQHLVDDSKALLAEIRSSNITVNAHTVHELQRVDAAGASVVAEELQAVKRRFAEAQREIARYKDKEQALLEGEGGEQQGGGLVGPAGAGGRQQHQKLLAENTEMRKHLQECQQQLLHAHSTQASIGSSAGSAGATGAAVLEGRGGDAPWLFIGIPTVSRNANQDYLLQTLASIRHQLPTDPNDLVSAPSYRAGCAFVLCVSCHLVLCTLCGPFTNPPSPSMPPCAAVPPRQGAGG